MYWRATRIDGNGSVKLIYSGTIAPTEEDAVTKLDIDYWFLQYVEALSLINNHCGSNINVQEFEHIYNWEHDKVSYIDPSIVDCVSSNMYVYVSYPEYQYAADNCGLTLEQVAGIYSWPSTYSPTQAERVCVETYSNEYEITAYVNAPWNILATVSQYNYQNDRPEYIGYMYELGKHRGHAQSSALKHAVDGWFQENMLPYQDYLNDFILCTDRSFDDAWEGPWVPANSMPDTPKYSDVNNRAFYENAPQLICPHKEDSYTVSDTTHGNGKLTYPAGVLTIEEAIIAGAGGGTNEEFYLTGGSDYWLVLTDIATVDVINGRYMYAWGDLSMRNVMEFLGVRPVVALKSTIMASGSGTWNNPYVIN